MKNIWRLFELVPGYKVRLLKVLIVNSALGLIVLATPFFYKDVLDQVVKAVSDSSANVVPQISISLGLLLAVSLTGVLLDYIAERLSDTLAIDILWEIRKKVFAHLSRLSIDFYERTRAGEIVERINTGTGEFSRWAQAIADGFLGVMLGIIFVLTLLWIKLPLVGLVMTVALSLSFYWAARKIITTKEMREDQRGYAERGMGEMNETLGQIGTVRSFGQEKSRLQRYVAQINNFRITRLQTSRVEWNINAYRGILNGITLTAVVGIVAYGTLQGRYSAGDILMVLLYLQQMRGNISPISRLIVNTGEIETSSKRLVELLEVEPTVQDAPGAKELPGLESIEFRQVDFRYPGKTKKVLSNISFKLNRGETLALVGPSGVGKSTITKLLLRFYEPTSGQIILNGQPIESFTQDSVRKALGMVMQDVALFNDTIKENLRFANSEATDTDIVASAKIAHADVFINKLPEKYETLVGERGVRLSGGEKQRVAIARAVLRNPQLVILDEATSALDSESERFVQEGLRALLKNKTAIIIAHRLSTVMRADQIIVLENGTVLEQGKHDELIKKGGLYAKLFSMQSDSLKSFDLLPGELDNIDSSAQKGHNKSRKLS